MPTTSQIIGIALIRNEERFIQWSLRNALSLCDRLIVADHYSTDDTARLVRALQKKDPRIEYHRIKSPAESHTIISPLAGGPYWVFGVDGDEIYDPAGLTRLRTALLSGEYDSWFNIKGNVLNCTHLDQTSNEAKGYLSPPCRSMTKLYNFSAIHEWAGVCPERLHGGHIRFAKGFDATRTCNLHLRHAWSNADLRCLHLCFLSRSRKDKPILPDNPKWARHSIAERGSRWRAWMLTIKSKLGWPQAPALKMAYYRRGALVTLPIHDFSPNPDT
jgi:hypothetical protein